MSHIGKNIRKIRTVKKLSQADFAALFNLARPSVGAYEEGRAEPKIETIIQIAAHFGIGIDMLLTKDITINELYHIDKFEKEVVQKQNVNDSGAVPLVEKDLLAQYMSQSKTSDFIRQLPVIHLPRSNRKEHRAFEVGSAEMQISSGGIHPGDIMLGKKSFVNDLIVAEVYLTFTANHFYLRRFSGKDDKLLLFEADNPDYVPVRLSEEELLEVWHIIGYYITRLPKPDTVESRLATLERQVTALQKIIGKK